MSNALEASELRVMSERSFWETEMDSLSFRITKSCCWTFSRVARSAA